MDNLSVVLQSKPILQNLLRWERLRNGYTLMSDKYGDSDSEPVLASLSMEQYHLVRRYCNRFQTILQKKFNFSFTISYICVLKIVDIGVFLWYNIFRTQYQ